MKYYVSNEAVYQVASHPARGAWIEIVVPFLVLVAVYVAPRKGCVD